MSFRLSGLAVLGVLLTLAILLGPTSRSTSPGLDVKRVAVATVHEKDATAGVLQNLAASETARLEASESALVDSAGQVGDWTQFQGGPSHNGFTVWPGPTTNTVAWNYTIGGSQDAITEQNGLLFVTQPGNSGLSWSDFNVSNGTEVFSFNDVCECLGQPSIGTNYLPIGDDEALFETTCGTFLFCPTSLNLVNITTGATTWSQIIYYVPTQASLYGAGLSAFYGGLFYFGFDDTSGETAYFPNGTVAWATHYPGEQSDLPTFGDGVMLEGFSSISEVSALWSGNGSNAWNLSTDGPIYTTAAFAAGDFYFGSANGTVYAVSSSGTLLWASNLTSAPIVATPVVSPSAAYVIDDDGILFALNRSTGRELWSAPLAGSAVSSPVLANNGVLFVASNSTLLAFNSTSGGVLWRYVSPSSFSCSPVLYRGQLYVANQNGTIFDFGPRYPVEFLQTGLPIGSSWLVNLTDESLKGSASSVWTVGSSTSTQLLVDVANGTYRYRIIPQNTDYSAPSGPPFSVFGSGGAVPLTISVDFTLVTYSIQVSEGGLFTGWTWEVTVSNVTRSSSSKTIDFALPNGTYSFEVGSVSGFSSDPHLGLLSVTGEAATLSITFSSTSVFTAGFGVFGQTQFLEFEAIYGCVLGSLGGVLYAMDETRRFRLIARAVWTFGGFLAYIDVMWFLGAWYSTPFLSLAGILPLLVVGIAFWLFGRLIDGYLSSMVIVSLLGVCLGVLAGGLILAAFTALAGSSPSYSIELVIVLIPFLLVWGLIAYPVFRWTRRDSNGQLIAGAVSGALVTALASYHLVLPSIPPAHSPQSGAILVAMAVGLALLYPLYFIADHFDFRGRLSDRN